MLSRFRISRARVSLVAGEVLFEDGGEDQQECKEADDIDGRTAFVGIRYEQNCGAVHTFNKERHGEGQEEGIARAPPEFKEEHSSRKR
jgi:hypothetical protein